MKAKIVVSVVLWVGWLNANAQLAEQQSSGNEEYVISIAYNKTSSIVFPTIIKGVDRGSKDVLVQKAMGVGNVLQLKANRPQFKETNLTVITADGALHQFKVSYSEEPASYRMEIAPSGNQTPLIFQSELTESDMDERAIAILESKRSVRFVNDKGFKIGLSLRGVYVKENVLFFRLRIENQSNLNYDVESFRFYIRDKAKIKRTASQEVEVKPIYSHGESKQIKGKSFSEIIFITERFTIPDSKLLNVELLEHNGGRHLELTVKNKTIVGADLIR